MSVTYFHNPNEENENLSTRYECAGTISIVHMMQAVGYAFFVYRFCIKTLTLGILCLEDKISMENKKKYVTIYHVPFL